MSPSTQPADIDGCDIGLKQLKPMNERTINFTTNNGYRKIVASIKAIGLIEPLSVYKEDGCYVILDGFLRYMACAQLDMETVPCLVYKDKQAYTFNRNVNRLSPYEEIRMLRKSLETIDEATIAQTFGMKSIHSRLIPHLVRQLHPDLVAAFKENVITKPTAKELMRVTHERQAEIFKEMKRLKDYTPSFCKTLVIQTTETQRNKNKPQQKAWVEDDERKRGMVARLAHAEKQHDFYAQLYRKYSGDLLKLTFFIRKMISNPKIEEYLGAHHADVLARFKAVIEGAA